MEEEKRRVQHERAERARLRHKAAVEKELLKHVKQAFESLCHLSAVEIRYLFLFITFIAHIILSTIYCSFTKQYTLTNVSDQ